MTKIKICGLTNLEDALKAEELGADFLGFIFFKESPRCIKPDKAKEIVAGLRGNSEKVGLFLDQDIQEVKDIARLSRLDILQLHGNEEPAYVAELKKEFKVIKTFRLKKGFDFNDLGMYNVTDFYLFDTFKKGMFGGTGVVFDWGFLEGKSFNKPIFLAGGLKPSNVKKAIERVKPYAVDVASGVESSPGKKNHKLLEEFINAAK